MAKAELRKLDKDIEEDEERHRLELKVRVQNETNGGMKTQPDVAVDIPSGGIATLDFSMCSGVQAEDEAPLVRTPEWSVGDQGQQLGVCRGLAERTGAN